LCGTFLLTRFTTNRDKTMAIKGNQIGNRHNAVCMISKIDDAIDWQVSDADAYAKTLDEKYLILLSGKEPTRFLCNFDLDAKSNSEIEDAMIAGVTENGTMKPGIGSYNLAVVRHVLKDIKNPVSLPVEEHLLFKRTADGKVSDETLDQLARLGIITEISAAFSSMTKGSVLRDRQSAKN